MRAPTRLASDRGYAMIAAVAGVAFFGLLALETMSGGRGAVVSAGAQAMRARMQAEADAGMAIAIHDLGADDASQRWSLKGETRTLQFNGDTLVIGVEDENGKIPLNFIAEPRVRALFTLAGAPSDKIDNLVQDFLTLRDGSGSSHGLSAIDELALLKDMTPDLYARIAPQVTINAVTLSFDPRTAKPLALAVMAPGNLAASAIAPPPDQELPPISLTGRAVTIRVEVRGEAGAALRKTDIVEFTGAPARPFVIRGVD